jgi:hypothetical protein
VLRMVHLLGADTFTVQVQPGRSIIVTEKVPAHDVPNRSTSDGSAGAGTDSAAAAVAASAPAPVAATADCTSTSKPRESHAVDGPSLSQAIGALELGLGCMGMSSNSDDQYEGTTGGSEVPRRARGRTLHLECGNMFDVKNIGIADIVMLETDIPTEIIPDLHKLLNNMKPGAKTLTYLDLRKTWVPSAMSNGSGIPTQLPFRQLEHNKNITDRFPTSWSVQRGHHFYLWCKVKTTNSHFSFYCYFFFFHLMILDFYYYRHEYLFFHPSELLMTTIVDTSNCKYPRPVLKPVGHVSDFVRKRTRGCDLLLHRL